MQLKLLRAYHRHSNQRGVWKTRIANSDQSRIVLNSEQRIVRIVQIVSNSANNGKQSRIVANSDKSQLMGYPESWSQPRSNVEWDFPAKKHRCLSGQKVFLNVISQGFNRCKSVNMSLLGYPCVFCFLNVSDGQPQPES